MLNSGFLCLSASACHPSTSSAQQATIDDFSEYVEEKSPDVLRTYGSPADGVTPSIMESQGKIASHAPGNSNDDEWIPVRGKGG